MDDLSDPFILHLHAHLIYHHPGRQRADFLQNLESVFFQRASCLHDVHNHLGKPHNGRKLNGTVQFDDLYGLMSLVIK